MPKPLWKGKIRMTTVMDYVASPPISRDTRTMRELFTSLHQETVEKGFRGVLIVFAVLFTSSFTLLGRGAHWAYRKAAGYQ